MELNKTKLVKKRNLNAKTMRNNVLYMCPMTKIIPIIRPVGELCNLKCAYCYYNSKNQTYCNDELIPNDIVEKFISQFLDIFNGEVTFLWHGGEPMLAGIEFYKRIIKIQEKYKKNHVIVNEIQTNGTLINSEWATFFAENDFHIGISLDGIKSCHNKFRAPNKESKIYDKVVNAIEHLRIHNIEPGILQTVTKSSMPHIRENFYYFINDLKIKKWGVNVYNDYGNNNPLMENESLDNEEYFKLYATLFDLWLQANDSSIEIREIKDFVSGVLGKYTGTCQTSGICSAFISVDNKGRITPSCDSYLGDLSSIEENIQTKNLIDILNGHNRINFALKANTLPEKCKHCEWIKGCFNGCTFFRNKNNEYFYCEGRKRLFSYIRDIINQ